MSTTHIVRIPGQFNLPAGWPKVEVTDTITGLFSHHVATDVSGVGADGEVTVWPSRTSVGDLTLASPSKPQYRVLGGGRGNVSFIATGPQWMHSEPLLRPRTGPMTIVTVMRFAPNGTGVLRHRAISTAGTGPGYFSISVIQETNVVTMETQNAGEIRLPLAPSTYAVIVAVYDGSSSSLSVNGVTKAGTIDSSGSEVGTIRLASNSSGTQSLNGRIAETRFYDRAFNASEVQAVTADLRSTHNV